MKVKEKTFNEFVDEVLMKGLPNDPYNKIQYPVKYAKFKAISSIVQQEVFNRLGDVKFMHEFKPEVRNIISVTVMATLYVQELDEERKKEVERLKKFNKMPIPDLHGLTGDEP